MAGTQPLFPTQSCQMKSSAEEVLWKGRAPCYEEDPCTNQHVWCIGFLASIAYPAGTATGRGSCMGMQMRMEGGRGAGRGSASHFLSIEPLPHPVATLGAGLIRRSSPALLLVLACTCSTPEMSQSGCHGAGQWSQTEWPQPLWVLLSGRTTEQQVRMRLYFSAGLSWLARGTFKYCGFHN